MGETALGITVLFSRAAKHTQHPVVNEKSTPPSWEHQPLASLPITCTGTSRNGCVGYTFSLARQDLWQELSHPVTPHSGVRWPGLNLAPPAQAGANSLHTVQDCGKLTGPQFPHL